MQDSITSLAQLEIPVIAAVHGYCIGGGIDLISACDIRLASADAVFSVRETKVAIVADLGTLQRLPRIVSAGHVAELAFTGKDIDAERAAQIGLVNSVCGESADDVLEAAYELAERSRRTPRSPCGEPRPYSPPTRGAASTRDSSSSHTGTSCTSRATISLKR